MEDGQNPNSQVRARLSLLVVKNVRIVHIIMQAGPVLRGAGNAKSVIDLNHFAAKCRSGQRKVHKVEQQGCEPEDTDDSEDLIGF